MKYIERQKFNQWWLWLIMFVTLAATAVPLFEGVMNGAIKAGMFLGPAVMFAVMILLATLELRTTITEDGIEVKFWPLGTKRIFRAEIEGAVVRKYSPIGEYGGWGYRIGPNGKAFNMQGNQGLQLALEGGEQLMIGTQKPEELATFMEAYLREEKLDEKALELRELRKNKLER